MVHYRSLWFFLYPVVNHTGLSKEVLIKLEILEVQDLCLATLEGHERLDYAKGLGLNSVKL